MSAHFLDDDTPWAGLGDGIRRKIVGHTPELMSVLVQFDKSAIGTSHAHDAHDPIADVIACRFECEIGGERCVLKPGDAFVAPLRFDRTHLGPNGAALFADQVEQGLLKLRPELSAARTLGP